MKNEYDYVLVMKVGPQKDETLAEIIERKNKEAIILDGYVYWGYGGVNLPPSRVQDWIKELKTKGKTVKVVFIETKSHFRGDNIVDAKEFSEDNISWHQIPKGTQITVSKYALKLRNIYESNSILDLNAYEIAAGPSEGNPLSEYLKGQSDKALARRKENPGIEDGPKIKIAFTADPVEPHAVYLK